MGTRALIYTRVSQDRAGGRSPAEQEAEGRQVCVREGWEVTEVVTDSLGASRHSKGTRRGWERARQLVADGAVDVLVTWEASRAQRDLAAYAELRELCARNGVRWSYSGRTYDMAEPSDRFTTGLDALLAEREADETAERVRRAMRGNAAQGRPHGRRLFGYQRVYDDRTGLLGGQVHLPDEAAVVREVFTGYLAGRGIRTLARELNSAGVTTSTGARWADGQVRRMLTNPAYAARRVHHGEVVGEADWPSIIDSETFDRVQARFAAMAGRQSRQTSAARLLTGVARCGVCGGRMHALHDRRGRKFYECNEKFCVARDLAKLDAYVTLVVLERLGRPDVTEALAGVAQDPAVTDARQRAQELRAQLDDAVEQFTAGKLTGATLAKIEAKMLPLIDDAEREARHALVPLEVDVPTSNVDAWWDGLTGEVRREIVATLLAAVVVLPTRKGTRGFDPTAVRIEWQG
ncbi:MAG TPA: recombinase family protein [Acidimicrobiales bacterium]|nr:recombinase family protein [Acidimicrobiales bacterium]